MLPNYLFNAFGISTQLGRLMLQINEILSTNTEAKKNGLRTNVHGREITQDNVSSLVKFAGSGKIDKLEFEKKFSKIDDDIKKSQDRMVEILLQLKELAPYKQLNIT